MRTSSRVLATTVLTVLAAGQFASAGHATSTTAAVSSPTFAGYQVVKTKGKITQARTTFVVPTITCKKNLSGVGPSVIVQTRLNNKGAYIQSGAGVGVACLNKQATYRAAVIVNGIETNDYQLAPGDRVRATVRIAGGSTQVAIKDITSGADKTATGAGNVGATALIGDASIAVGSTSVGVDPFTRTQFSGAQVNGKPIGKLGAVAVQRTHGTTVQIAVSKLVKEKTFHLTFKNSR
jgi:hypothetical protein